MRQSHCALGSYDTSLQAEARTSEGGRRNRAGAAEWRTASASSQRARRQPAPTQSHQCPLPSPGRPSGPPAGRRRGRPPGCAAASPPPSPPAMRCPPGGAIAAPPPPVSGPTCSRAPDHGGRAQGVCVSEREDQHRVFRLFTLPPQPVGTWRVATSSSCDHALRPRLFIARARTLKERSAVGGACQLGQRLDAGASGGDEHAPGSLSSVNTRSRPSKRVTQSNASPRAFTISGWVGRT